MKSTKSFSQNQKKTLFIKYIRSSNEVINTSVNHLRAFLKDWHLYFVSLYQASYIVKNIFHLKLLTKPTNKCDFCRDYGRDKWSYNIKVWYASLKNGTLRARLVCVFKNWKLLFKKIYGNTCGWKSMLKCVKCCLKTENCCLKTQTKHPLTFVQGQLQW